MKVLIDLQGAQSGSRFRGIGRYTLEVINAIILESGKEDEIHLLINASLIDGAQHLQNFFAQKIPRSQIHSCCAKTTGINWYGFANST
jgi:hypothetical protein